MCAGFLCGVLIFNVLFSVLSGFAGRDFKNAPYECEGGIKKSARGSPVGITYDDKR